MSSLSPAPVLAAETTVGAVALTVSDIARARTFYEEVLGLEGVSQGDADVALGAPGGPALVRLHGDPSAPALNPRATGLFHLAVLLPTRLDLAHALGRLAQSRHPLSGASDHLVSEAVYLNDPDGNGIELYRDRPREQWRREADGSIAMATLPLDLRGVLEELGDDDEPRPRVPDATRMGHVHLQVADIAASEGFYHGVLGFDVTVRAYPGALFVSAGGYHHHLGLNTWNSRGAGAPPAGSVGLSAYEVVVPDAAELRRILQRVAEAGLVTESAAMAGPGAAQLRDPSGNMVVLRAH
jgi:catechol 2,3-dioxygenase